MDREHERVFNDRYGPRVRVTARPGIFLLPCNCRIVFAKFLSIYAILVKARSVLPNIFLSRLGLGHCVGAHVYPYHGYYLASFPTEAHTGYDVRCYGLIVRCYHPSDHAQ